MSKIRSALAAGAMVASALVVPVTMPAQAAVAGTPTQASSGMTTALLQGPCRNANNPQRCRDRRNNNNNNNNNNNGGRANNNNNNNNGGRANNNNNNNNNGGRGNNNNNNNNNNGGGGNNNNNNNNNGGGGTTTIITTTTENPQNGLDALLAGPRGLERGVGPRISG